MVLTLTRAFGTDASRIDAIAAEMLRVSGGPVVVLASIYSDLWASAFRSKGASVRRATYLTDALDVIVADGDHLELPDERTTLCDLIRVLIEQAGSGTVIDPFASAWLVALPTILCNMRYVGLCTAGDGGADVVAEIIARKLVGADRNEQRDTKRRMADAH
jgi:hypothetical protein